MDKLYTEISYNSPQPTWSDHYLWPRLEQIILSEKLSEQRIFELGCGNGVTADKLAKHGFSITAVDPSKSGIAVARAAFSQVNFAEASAYDDLAAKFGTFPLVVSLEVVEHLYFPRCFAQSIYNLLEHGGKAIISTPYHGYWKNLALAVTGKLDSHFTALWDGGHVKFWSRKTLCHLLEEAGFRDIIFYRVGRIPVLAKSMIAVARKPLRSNN